MGRLLGEYGDRYDSTQDPHEAAPVHGRRYFERS